MSSSAPVLKERYELERELGRGGMSVVYLARDRQLMSKPVVIKVLLEQSAADAWVRQKFQQEMEALARIDHPGVIGVLDTGVTPSGKQFLVMQYVEGATLRGAIAPGGMDLRRAAGIIRQIAQALAAAHEKGVWHRDLKPENIMLQAVPGGEHVKLIDFGIAGIQNSAFGGQATKVAGTATYMAPEQFAGSPSAASDTYALGVVAYEMLTGRMPFSSDTMLHLVSEEKARPVAPRELRRDVPEAAERAILRAISFRAEDRQSPISAFGEELYQALTTTVSQPQAPAEPAVPAPRPRSKAPLLAAVLALVLLAAAAGWWLTRPKTETLHLNYSVQVLKANETEPRHLAAETVFDRGDGIALEVFSPSPGYLYVLDYGREADSGQFTYNLLSPMNAGDARRAANVAVRIPPQQWFRFDAASGQETLYLVWSKGPVPELERLKLLPQDRGVVVIKDAAGMTTLQNFLKSHNSRKDINQQAGLTELHTDGDVLVHAIAMEHL